jgi:hypothetical protein
MISKTRTNKDYTYQKKNSFKNYARSNFADKVPEYSQGTNRNIGNIGDGSYHCKTSDNVGEPSVTDIPRSHSPQALQKSTQEHQKFNPKFFRVDFNTFKSAGIIPYTQHNGVTLFLLQRLVSGTDNKNAFGWNDFGGKKSKADANIFETAAREFGEETSCLFYLSENSSESCSPDLEIAYSTLKSSQNAEYDAQGVELLCSLIPENKKYFAKRLDTMVNSLSYQQPLYVSHKDVYVSYFMKVKYIPAEDIPVSEDLHIHYETRFIRECKWFTFTELMQLERNEFHRRLQITPLHERVSHYYKESLLN